MASDIEGLALREGHFLLESGLHAATWIDLDTLFLEPKTHMPTPMRFIFVSLGLGVVAGWLLMAAGGAVSMVVGLLAP